MNEAPAIAALKQRWLADVRALGCRDARLGEKLFDRLADAYGEPQRAYHTLTHLEDLFAKLDAHGRKSLDRPRLAFAAWYHDIVYVPGARDNEAKSAERARAELAEMDADAGLIARVMRAIRATASHTKGGADDDDNLFLDADFSILGAAPEDYRRYVAGVRREYADVDDAAWRNGRGAFLALALGQPRIFHTDAFENAYAAQARANIRAELQSLTGSNF